MRKLTMMALVGALLLAACTAPGRDARDSGESGRYYRDAPGSIWKHNRVPDGGN